MVCVFCFTAHKAVLIKILAFSAKARYNSKKMGGKPLQIHSFKQNRPQLFSAIFCAVLFVLLLVPQLQSLRGLFLALLAGISFSFYPVGIACAMTGISLTLSMITAQVGLVSFFCGVLLYLPVGILLGCFFKKPPAPTPFLGYTLLTETAGVGLSLLLFSRHAGFSVWDRFFQNVSTYLQSAFDEMATSGILGSDVDLDLLRQATETAVELYRQRVPFFMLAASAGIALLLFVILWGIRRVCGIRHAPLPPFYCFRLSKASALFLLISFAGSLLFSGNVALALENLYAFLTLLAVVAGLAYAAYWLRQKGVPRALRVLILIVTVFVTLLFSLLWYFLLMLGLTDAIWNLRSTRLSGRKE